MALFSKSDDSISEELLKKSMDASKGAQEVVINATEDASEISDKHSLTYLEASGIDATAAIDILGDKDTFDRRLRDFASLAKSKYGSLMECKASLDMAKYSIESEALKKECNYLGIKKLFVMAKKHEQESKSGDSTYVIDHFKEYEDEIKRIIEVVEAYLA
jgi:hypothetical protein